MKDTTKNFYHEDIWSQIETHPGYNLGRRELNALIRFLPTVAEKISGPTNILHLGVATGQEVPHIIQNISNIKEYLLNDICEPVIKKTGQQMKWKFPKINFSIAVADVEKAKVIKKLRQKLSGPTLIVLVANSVLFSNRQMDKNIFEAIGKEDLFLLTVERPHPKMYDSYLILPVLKLLSEGGVEITRKNIKCWYDDKSHTINMACKGKILLSSYKPTPLQLREQMTNAGFTEVTLAEYKNLHMIASLWRKK